MMALLFGLSLCGVAAEDPFQAFREGRFEDAYALFKATLDAEGAGDGAVCVNLGRCAERLGRPAEALWWLERARLRRAGDAELDRTIERLEGRLGIRPVTAKDPLDATLRALRRLLPGTRLGLGFAIEVLALFLLVAGFRHRARRSTAIVLLVLAGAIVVDASGTGLETRRGIVLRTAAVLRSEPHRQVSPLATLRGGERVEVLEASDRWILARRGKVKGWIEKGELGVVE